MSYKFNFLLNNNEEAADFFLSIHLYFSDLKIQLNFIKKIIFGNE